MQQKEKLKGIAVKEVVYLKLKTLGRFGMSYSDLIQELVEGVNTNHGEIVEKLE